MHVSPGFTKAPANELSGDFYFLNFPCGNCTSKKPRKLWLMLVCPPNECVRDTHYVPVIMLCAERTTVTQIDKLLLSESLELVGNHQITSQIVNYKRMHSKELPSKRIGSHGRI